MNILLIDLRAQSLKAEISHAVERVLESGVYVTGPEASQFENETALIDANEICRFHNQWYGFSYIQVCGIGQGDEVITSMHTFFATAEAIARVFGL